MCKPRYYFENETSVPEKAAGRGVALFLDFDGTLVPIQKDPAECFLSKRVKELLNSLRGNCASLMILSGRSLPDIKRRVGLRGIYYGGNHGLDIWGPDLRFTHPAALASKPRLQSVALKLKKELASIEGAWVEDKHFSVSVHYRAVRKECLILVRRAFRRVAGDLIDEKVLKVIEGKRVLELTPAISWDKGCAVLWMLEQLNDRCIPIYIGDDQTDETAFRVLRNTGITLRVGKSVKTAANFYLRGQWEVPQLMMEMSLCGGSGPADTDIPGDIENQDEQRS